MTRTRKRDRAGGQTGANPETSSRNHCHHNNRIPPHTPPAIAKALERALKRLDSLADAGVNVSLIAGFDDELGQRTGLLILDQDTYAMAGPPPCGLAPVRVGTAAHDA